MCTACCYQMSVLTFIQIPCFYIGIYFVVVQSLSCVQLFVPLWTAARQASLSFTISQSLLKLTFIGSVIPSNSIFLFHPFLLLPPIFPSVRVFSNDLALRIRWQKYWSFILSLSPSNEYLLLISFRITWLDLLAVQGNLKILLQHHSLKASVIQHSAFVMVQLSHPYMTMGKTIALTIATFVGKDFISLKYSFPLIVSIWFQDILPLHYSEVYR